MIANFLADGFLRTLAATLEMGVGADQTTAGVDCESLILMVGDEKVKPVALKCSQVPSSERLVTATSLVPFASMIEMVAAMGALVNPYKHLATSERITKSYRPWKIEPSGL